MGAAPVRTSPNTREEFADLHADLLRQNTATTELVKTLADEIHEHVCAPS